MQLQFQYLDDLITLTVEPDGDGWRVRLPEGEERRIRAARRPDGSLRIIERGAEETPDRIFEVPFARDESGIEFSYEGMSYRFAPSTVRRPAGRKSAGGGTLVAPMVGVVADVLVAEGQAVEAYQTLVVIEAMKVMAKLDAPFAGTVGRVHVHKGQQVSHGEPLIEVTPFELAATSTVSEAAP